MNPMLRRFALVFAVAPLFVTAPAHADTHVVAPEGGGMPALAVDIDAGRVRTRSCEHAQGCTVDRAAEGVAIPLDRALFPNDVSAQAEVVPLGDGRHAVHVFVQAKSQAQSSRNVAWEAVFAGGERAPLFADLTGFSRGEEGEHTGWALQLHPNGDDAKYVIRGEVREDLHICGQARGTLLSPEMLDAKTLKWKSVGLQRIPAAQREAATRVVAVAKGGPADAPLGKLLVAVGSSGGDSGGALTDGDARTAWAENRAKDGRGEFVVMRAPQEVPIARFAIVPSPDLATRSASGASPKVVYLVTDTQTIAVTIPEDAWTHPGSAYDIALATPIRTSCISLVLDEAYAHDAAPDVMVAELYAYSEFDAPGATLDAAAQALSGPRADAAAAFLRRAGDAGLLAMDGAFDKLDAKGRALAVEAAIGQPSCEQAAPLLVRALVGRDKELSHRARAKIARCGTAAAKALVTALANPVTRARVAPVLAEIDPAGAIAPLTGLLGEGERDARGAVRNALTVALRTADVATLKAMLADEARPANARVELLRAARERLREASAEGDLAIAKLLDPSAPMATRYRLVGPVAALARAGDAQALALLESLATKDADWPVRVAAVEASSSIASLVPMLVRAAADPEPRVREAALKAAESSAAEAMAGAAADRLAKDGWTFVRVAAVIALARGPRGAVADGALISALTKDAAPHVRGAAAAALGVRHAGSAADALRARAADKEEDLEVRVAAIEALGDVCDARAIETLTSLTRVASQPMITEPDARLGAAAIEALGKLHPSDLGKRLAPALDPAAPRAARALAQRAMQAPAACGR